MKPRFSLPIRLVALGSALGLGLLVLVASFLFGGQRPAVDWNRLRAVAIESDDWGLPGFIPSLNALEGLDKDELAPGAFPPVYWGSTLEDSAGVASLCAVLARYRGADGLPAVFQPNYVTGSWEWVPDSLAGSATGSWRQHDFPAFPARYERQGLLAAVRRGIAAGTWYPELHARWHYDPDLRFELALSTAAARAATARGILLFPDSEKARELGPWRSVADLNRELAESRAIFAAAFGRPAGSIIAPDYTWNSAMEDLWAHHGFRVIQAKREQRDPGLGHGKVARARKFLARQWALRRHPDRQYLERNCRLEPVQWDVPEEVVDRCLAETRQAWRAGQPAIVESHRVNFAHLDPAVQETGLRALDAYLSQVTAGPALPIFLSDVEIAQLAARGTSWVRRGERLILRNGTHSGRVVAVPRPFCPVGAGPGAMSLFLVPAGCTVLIDAQGDVITRPLGS